METYKIITTDAFEKELEHIYNYTNYFLQEPIVAKRIYNKIIDGIYSLRYFPQRGLKVKEYNNTELRRIIIKNYIILYDIDEKNKKVFIHKILYNKRNYLKQI